MASKKRDLLQPRDDVGKIKDMSCSVCIAGTDRSREWLKRQRTAVKGCYSSRVKTFWLAGTTRESGEDRTAKEGQHTL